MIKKILIVLFLMALLIFPVSAAVYNVFTADNYQGYLYLNQTITFYQSPLSICQYWNPAYTKMSGWEIGLGRATTIASGQNLMGTNVTWGLTRPFTNAAAASKWITGESWNVGTYPSTYNGSWVGESANCNPIGDGVTGRWWIFKNETPPSETYFVTTVVRTIDATTGSQIRGTTINIRDVQNNSWVNSTEDADGELVINTLVSHTLDIYGSYPGVYTSSYELGATPGGGYEYPYLLPMYSPVPPAPAGYVNVLTYVKDAQTDFSIGSAKVVYRYQSSGTEVTTFTDTYGSSLAVLQNATVVIISTSKSEYNSQSESHTLPNFGDVMYVVRLSKPGLPSPTVAPTDDSGNVITPVPTYLQYCNPAAGDYDAGLCGHSQDMALFGQLREWGSTIMMLAILAIIFGLLKMIMKF